LITVSLYSAKTGWISSETLQYIYVTVVGEAEATLSVDTLNPLSGLSYYCPGDVVNVSNILVNIGDSNITGDLVDRIFDSDNNEVHSQTWSSILLPLGENQTYNTLYTIPIDPVVGTYKSEGNFSYENQFIYSSDNFEVRKGIGNFLVSTSSISVTLSPGNYTIRNITFWLQEACDNTIVFLNASSNIPGEWVNFTTKNVLLTPFITNSTTLNISIPKDFITEGVYNGTIYAQADGQVRLIDLSVRVSGKTFSLNVTVPSYKKEVCPEESIPGIIGISKNFPGIVDVNMTYQIKDFGDSVYDEKNETIQVDDSLETVTSLTAPSSTGYYTFYSMLQHNSSVVDDSDTFRVVECAAPKAPTGPSGGGGGPPAIKIYDITLRLSKNILTVVQGNKTSFIAYVNNTGSISVDSIKLSISGIPMNWIEILPMEISVNPSEEKEFLVVIDVPEDAEIGLRRLGIIAKNDIESNKEILSLVIARDPKEIIDFLLPELGRLRTLANDSLLIGDCIDVSLIKSYFSDAELARERGLKEYESENYKNAIQWFEHAISVYDQVVSRVDITVELEITNTNSSKFIMPPAVDSDEQFVLANTYFIQRKYDKVCEPIEKLRDYMLIGLIFWPIVGITPIIIIIILIILYKKKREKDVIAILDRVRDRLGTKEPEA
jgi:hypothetical protein